MEEDFAPQMGSQSSSYVIRYGLGARGIDYVEKTQGGTASKAYPLYDGHGNMIATISPSGTISNQRAYDAWGGVRAESGVDSTNPNGRYCANLGHKQDDESGLIYMRARYCDPATGRFVTEDPAMDGANWFVYCDNDPVNFVDWSGKAKTFSALLGALLTGFFGYLLGLVMGGNQYVQVAFTALASIASEWFVSNEAVGSAAIRLGSTVGHRAVAIARAIAQGVGRGFMSYYKSLEGMSSKWLPLGPPFFTLLIAAYAGALWAEIFGQEVDDYF